MQDKQRPPTPFDQAICFLPKPLSQSLSNLPDRVKADVHEIRLRVGRPLSLWTGRAILYITDQGEVTDCPERGQVPGLSDLEEAVRTLCCFSIHTHAEEMREGYISIPGGHRAGLCGTAAYEGDKLLAIREVSSIDLRIARELPGAADQLLLETLQKREGGLLLAGAPGSGKTTLLRDLARQLSNGSLGRPIKVAVVDERGEVGAQVHGVPGSDIGWNTDLLTGYRKADGILQAVRVLSPAYLLCDELGTPAEADAVSACLGSGVQVVTTLHASTREELLRRPQYQRLLQTGAFDWVALLQGGDRPGCLQSVWKAEEDHAIAG